MSEDAGRESTAAVETDAANPTDAADDENVDQNTKLAKSGQPWESRLSRPSDVATRPGFRSTRNSRSKAQRKNKKGRKGRKK